MDPREYELPDAGLLYVEDAETGEQLLVDSSDPQLRGRLLAVTEEQDDCDPARGRPGPGRPPCRVDRGRSCERFRPDGGERPKAPSMTFVSPGWLFGLLLLPVVVVAYVVARRKRRQRTAALAAQGLFTTGLARRRTWRLHVPFVLFLVALALLVVASARPMTTVKTPRREATVVLAIDVSNSMAAADVKPSRIGAAKIAAADFVREQPAGVRIGVVAFGPSARDRATSQLRSRCRAATRSITFPWEVERLWRRASSHRSMPSPAKR